MKVTIAIDSLKGSLTSMEAGNAIKAGILKAVPSAEVTVRPMADGGEGTTDALVEGMGGHYETITVTGPLGEKVEAQYGIVEDTKTAVIEMSSAAGITLVPDEKRNPLLTTTYGVGEVIKDAIGKGCRSFLVGIGGSATNDAGIGMLQALGYELLDKDGKQVACGAAGVKDIETINLANVLPDLKECQFRVACDVTNPLCGEKGCSAVFGPQKGATPEMVRDMDQWLGAFAQKVCAVIPGANPDAEGCGAAGGLGFALMAFLGAKLDSGIDIVLEETKLESYIKDADYVVTGEGRLDSQTVMGKAPSGVAGIAKKYGKPVYAFAGSVTKDAGVCNKHGIDAFFPILRRISTLEAAMDSETAAANMTDTAEQVFRLVASIRA